MPTQATQSKVHSCDAAYVPMAPRDYLILLGLAAGASHGYGLIGEIEALTDGATSMDPANLYRAVKRLKRDELVEDLGRRAVPAADGAASNDAPRDERRRYYGLTATGRRALQAESLRLERLTAVARERRLVPSAEGLR